MTTVSSTGQRATAPTSDATDPTFSPVENEPPLRWQRALGLAPRTGFGLGRRAVFFTALAWLPLAVWAAVTRHLWEGPAGESLLQHFAVNARCLVAIPLMVFAEGSMHKVVSAMMRQFTQTGIVGSGSSDGLARILRETTRLRDASLPWVVMLGVAVAWTLVDIPDPRTDELAWAVESDGTLGFGGLWLAYVARPIFIALLLGWLWRLVLLVVLFARIGRLDLSLVPTHPDRVGGLGFVEPLPMAMSLVTFAIAIVLTSRWAHEIFYHDQTIASFKMVAAAFVIGWSCLLLLPLLALAPALVAAKRRALLDYSELVGRHGRLVARRWIRGESVSDASLLDAAEIGPVADTAAIYQSVEAMRPLPIGRRSLIPILVPMLLPMIVLVLTRVPIKDVLLRLLKAMI